MTTLTDAENARRTVTAIIGINIPFLPLIANMITVWSGAWAFGRLHSYQLALLVLLAIVTALRTRLRLGIAFNIVVVIASLVMLFWSSEPLAYLAYGAFLLAAVVILFGVVYALTRHKSRQ